MMETWLPHKLRTLRVRQGLTLIEAAKKTGVTRATLSDLERGHRHPVATTLLKIAEGYGIPVEELIEEPVPLGEAPRSEAGQSEAGAEEKLERVALVGTLRRLSAWGRESAENEHKSAALLRAMEHIDDVLFNKAYSLYHSLRERGDEADDLVEPIEEMMRVFASLIDALEESEGGVMADAIDFPALRKKTESIKRGLHRSPTRGRWSSSSTLPPVERRRSR
jgi:transcriptional regulator with XRE-family HTH domain